jgi:hypothetical protein
MKTFFCENWTLINENKWKKTPESYATRNTQPKNFPRASRAVVCNLRCHAACVFLILQKSHRTPMKEALNSIKQTIEVN